MNKFQQKVLQIKILINYSSILLNIFKILKKYKLIKCPFIY